nr:hypothetical protein [Aquitalea magnusonii]
MFAPVGSAAGAFFTGTGIATEMRRVFHVDGQLVGFRQGKECACGLTQCRHLVSGDTMADQIKETVIARCATQLLQQLLALFGTAIEQAEIDDRQGKRA